MENTQDLERIRKWLLEQVDKTFPEENKEEFRQQIIAMNEEELISFLKKNHLIKNEEEIETGEESLQKCVFCSIASGEIPSTKIGENEKAIAILDINPVSEGHVLIIPKEHVSNPSSIPEEAKNLANNIAKKLQQVFSPKKVEITNSEAMNHFMINIFPVYENESLTSQRKRKTPQELTELKTKIEAYQELSPSEKKEELKIEETPKPQVFNDKNFWLPKRRP